MHELSGALPRYGVHVVALGLLYAALATSWSWLRATGLFSLGQAAFFGAGALAQAWLVTAQRISPWLALPASAVAGALISLPLIPSLHLGPGGFGLATLTYWILLKGLAGNVPGLGMEGFLMPANPAFEGAAPGVVTMLAGLALAGSLGYRVFLGRPNGRATAAIRQAPETALSLGIDPIGERWLPLTSSAAATALAGALYAHLVGSVEASVVFSASFSVLPLVLGMLGGSLHPLGGIVGTLALYPLDELIFRTALPRAHTLAYGLALLLLLLLKPEGLLGVRIAKVPAAPAPRDVTREPFGLTVDRLTVRRDRTTVLSDVSFALEPGQILRVVGPNGAGKTSLLLAIAGRLRASRGAIFFGDEGAPRGPAARARRGAARTFQAPRPFAEWTVRENVSIAAERAGASGEVAGLLAELDLTALEDRPSGRLSVGEGKRLELARALVSRPAMLLLDEPLAGLTPDAAERASRLIERASRRGATVIWVEHGPVSGGSADRLLVLEGGQIRFLGSIGEWGAARPAPPT